MGGKDVLALLSNFSKDGLAVRSERWIHRSGQTWEVFPPSLVVKRYGFTEAIPLGQLRHSCGLGRGHLLMQNLEIMENIVWTKIFSLQDDFDTVKKCFYL